MRVTDTTWRALEFRKSSLRRPIARVLLASVALLIVLGLFLLVRRATGALTAPLPPLPLATTALALLTWAWSVRIGWSQLVEPEIIGKSKADRWLFVWLPSAAIVLFAVACSYPGNRIVDWLVWVPAIAAASAPRNSRHPARLCSLAIKPELKPEKLLQQLTRFRTAEGNELIQGTLLAEFVPGERSVDLFVGFCPPFERLPDVEAEPEDGADVTVKLVQVLHNGAQLEVRLARPATSATGISIQFFAAEPQSH